MACSYTLASTAQSFPASATNSSVNLATPAGCGWNASSGAAWVTLGAANGTGPAALPFSVAANPNNSTRTATMTVAGQAFTVTQAAGACTFTLSPAVAKQFGQNGGTGSVAVSCGTGCAWTPVSSAGWVTLGATGGTGAGSVTYTVGKNTTTSARTATITISGQTHTISQDPVNRPTQPKKPRVTSVIGG